MKTKAICSRGVFRTLSNIYEEKILWKQLHHRRVHGVKCVFEQYVEGYLFQNVLKTYRKREGVPIKFFFL